MLSVFGKTQAERTIVSAIATVEIRGTGCYIEDEGSGKAARTYLCQCYGSIERTPSAAPHERESYSTSHHERLLYIYNDMDMLTMIAPASFINHTDDELTLLEGLVGRWPAFYGKAGDKY